MKCKLPVSKKCRGILLFVLVAGLVATQSASRLTAQSATPLPESICSIVNGLFPLTTELYYSIEYINNNDRVLNNSNRVILEHRGIYEVELSPDRHFLSWQELDENNQVKLSIIDIAGVPVFSTYINTYEIFRPYTYWLNSSEILIYMHSGRNQIFPFAVINPFTTDIHYIHDLPLPIVEHYNIPPTESPLIPYTDDLKTFSISPNGQFILTSMFSTNYSTLYDINDNSILEIPYPVGGGLWSFDSRSILFPQYSRDDETGVYIYDVDSNAITRLQQIAPIQSYISTYSWSPSNEYLALFASDNVTDDSRLQLIHVPTGTRIDTCFFMSNDNPPWGSYDFQPAPWSSDEQYLAFVGWIDADEQQKGLYVLDLTTWEVSLIEAIESDTINILGWQSE